MDVLSKNLVRVMWEQSFALDKELTKLQINNYPSKEIREFIQELKNVNMQFMDILYSAWSNPSDNPYLDQLQMKVLNKLWQSVFAVVGAALHTNMNDHPLEVMIPVKELVTQLGVDPNFITEPSWEINYAIGELWKPLATSLDRIGIQTNPTQRIRIIFPTLHKENVLLGSIMGHELGHYLDLHYPLNITQDLLPVILKHHNLQDLVSYLQYSHYEFPQDVSIHLVRLILSQTVLKNWLQEFIADIAGILLYGPASHISGEQVFMFFGVSEVDDQSSTLIDRYSSSHPRNWTRSQVRRRVLERLGYDEVFPEKIKCVVEQWHEGWEKAGTPPLNLTYSDEFGDQSISFQFNNESLSKIEDMLLDHLDVIIEKVINTIPNEVHYSCELIKTTVLPLSEKLSNLIPPNELNGEPVDSISILNAGWFAYYLWGESIKQQRGGIEGKEAEVELLELLNNLIRKALTSAYIHRRWNNANTVR